MLVAIRMASISVVSQQFVVILHHALDAEFIGHSLGDFQADIADRHQVRFRDVPGDVADVDAAHAPCSDHGDFYFSCHFSLSLWTYYLLLYSI